MNSMQHLIFFSVTSVGLQYRFSSAGLNPPKFFPLRPSLSFSQKQKSLFLFYKKRQKIISPPAGLLIRPLACSSWLLALGSWITRVLSYLSAWGAGRGQKATMWPSLLHLQISMLGGLFIYLNQGADLWQALVGLRPLEPPAPL